MAEVTSLVQEARWVVVMVVMIVVMIGVMIMMFN